MLFFETLHLIIKGRNKQQYKNGLNDKSSNVKKQPAPIGKIFQNHKKHPEKNHQKTTVQKGTKFKNY